MADITNLNQTASDNDRLMSSWINSVRSKIVELDQSLALANEQINSFRNELSQAFKVTSAGGLSATVAGGSLKLTQQGTVFTVSSTTITLTNNATNYIFISDTGVVSVSTTRPSTGLEIARSVTLNGSISSIQNFPLFKTELGQLNLSDYSTIDYANSRVQRLVALGRKTGTQGLPARDTYYTVTYQSLEGAGLNTAGTFTCAIAGKYIFHSQLRCDTTTPQSSPDLAIKMSLFFETDETGLPLQQGESAYGDITLNAQNSAPLQMSIGQRAYIKAYVTQGSNVRVREGSVVSVWLLPS